MKLTLSAQLCLLIVLFHSHSSTAKRGGGFFGKSFGFKKPFSFGRGKTGIKNNRGSGSQGSYPKQPSHTNQGGYSQYPGRSSSYPQQPHGSPYGGGYGGQGSFGGYGWGYGRPGGSINQNPNNPIPNPRYGSNFGYQHQGFGRGSPFSRSVQAMNVEPNEKSRSFGHSAVMAAGGGAVAGMALGYGLGRFPRPHFHFHNPQEEYYYNHYMYRKYGVKSTDTNDYGRDYRYSPPPETYDSFMDSCMKRTDVLPPANTNPSSKSGVTTPILTLAPGETNTTDLGNSSTSSSLPPTQPQADAMPPAGQAVNSEADEDTVSIVEIGYPALIKQVQARRCLELYIVYSEKYMKRQTGGTQGLAIAMDGFLIVLTSALVLLHDAT
ncbi:prion protein, related sequence 3 [Syngnathoides biaculeatus]|uniref:prion protein, related sequence 3 n=1 Tax=Syngnathoides biaculeatus TaxID=300417 RepID=UPI002ADD6D7B|nr:prion protein, related sequence 3 [Syngnathoides biaculeatus]